jgi:hypothetical protein
VLLGATIPVQDANREWKFTAPPQGQCKSEGRLFILHKFGAASGQLGRSDLDKVARSNLLQFVWEGDRVLASRQH